MSIPNDYVPLIDALEAAMRHADLTWTEPQPEVFEARLLKYGIRFLSYVDEDSEGFSYIECSIWGSGKKKGEAELDSFREYDQDDGFGRLLKIWGSARRRVRKVELVLRDIVKELRSLTGDEDAESSES